MTTNDEILLTKIESIRAKNNGTWMDLVRLSMELAPGGTKAILRQILTADQQISALVEELTQ